ncbi:MAG: site-specific DNA-methyltransferase [Solobacterium sp.]|nr:site-specific DNA-methyltransferase [Solobacterium sp.]
MDLVFTDPPYGMRKQKDGVANDNQNFDDLLEFNKKWIPLSFDALKDTGSWYCWGMDQPLMDIYEHILKPYMKRHDEKKITFRNLLTWDKGNGQGQLSALFRMYAIADEKCLFVMKGRQDYGQTQEDYWEGFEPIRQHFDEERKKTGLSTDKLVELAGATSITHWWSKSQWMFPNEERYLAYRQALRNAGIPGFQQPDDAIRQEYDAIRQEYDAIRQEWYKTRAYFDNTHDNMNNVWHFMRVNAGTGEYKSVGGHATPKPIKLCERAIKTSSRPGEIVLDLFGGSGSTLIACENLQRRCYMMELMPHWCDVILHRWEQHTGKTAYKEEI